MRKKRAWMGHPAAMDGTRRKPMLGIMIFLWVWMLHLPRALTMDASRDLGNEWTSVFEALVFSGIAFMLASLPVSSRFSIAKKSEASQ